MALTLLRHAPLHPKHQGRYNGWSDLPIEPSLFDAQAVRLLTQQHFDHIYSSDLLRCTQTLAYMGIERYTTDKRLREVRFKAHVEGKSFEEISTLPSYSQDLLESRETWHDYICDESQPAFEQRIRTFLNDLPSKGEILICSHAGTLKKMLYFLGISKETIDYLEWVRIERYSSMMREE
ncbi:MAG: histidine phosphatase family protein [Sulfurovum sp.]|nr:histidine phosphatase family protein [Sulfurovum sp.]